MRFGECGAIEAIDFSAVSSFRSGVYPVVEFIDDALWILDRSNAGLFC